VAKAASALQSFTEADPVYAAGTNATAQRFQALENRSNVWNSVTGKVDQSDTIYTGTVAKASAAHGWGDHAAAGYADQSDLSAVSNIAAAAQATANSNATELSGKHPLEDQRLSTTNKPTLAGLTVSEMVSTKGTISGTDAGVFAGEYSYAGTDGTYGSYFTNSSGKVLWMDTMLNYVNGWTLGDAVGSTTYYDDGWWADLNYESVDIVLTGTPSCSQAGSVEVYRIAFVDNGTAPAQTTPSRISTDPCGLSFNTPFSFMFNSEFLNDFGGWSSLAMGIGKTNYCSFLIGYEGNPYLPDEPVFAMFNDTAYRELSEQSSPYVIGLRTKVYKIFYTFVIKPSVIPTGRTDAQIGGIYVEGTNEVLKIRLTE
jgi:hypothetical protein